MSDDPNAQTSMFGVVRTLEMHVVSAHSRVLADGSETFVAEHVRWNRGRQARRFVPRSKQDSAPAPGQISLFGPPIEPETP